MSVKNITFNVNLDLKTVILSTIISAIGYKVGKIAKENEELKKMKGE